MNTKNALSSFLPYLVANCLQSEKRTRKMNQNFRHVCKFIARKMVRP